MPSVDTIRTITIQGKTDGVDDATAALDRLTDSIKSANDNLAKSNAVTQDNSDGWRLTGEGAATAANHLRQAAEAAYAFSPAFRGVVNEMAVPALGAANTALAAVAAGIVTATNYAGTGVIALAGAAEKASPSLLAYTTGVRSAGIAMEAFSPTIGTAAGSLLSFLAPALRLVGWFTLAVKGIEMVGEAWQLGGEKLAEYVALSEKAVADNISTDFFQRITKAAADAKQPVDLLTTAFKNLNDATADKLGGSTGASRIDELMNSKNFNGATGNFSGNTGVGELANANTTQEKFKAISDLIDQAMQKGERLAALDVARTFLGAAVADNLAKDSDYLNKMLASADKVKDDDLVSQASVDNAVALQNRLDAAEKILSERWHPIQDLLTAAGIAMKEAWVDIVESMATAFDWAAKLVEKLASPGNYAALQKAIDADIAISMDAQGIGVHTPDPAEAALAAARQKLGSGLQNPANVGAATDQINSIQTKVFPDVSKDPGAKAVEDSTAAYDRAEESILKYIETTKAAALTVSDAAGEQEKFKVIAQLTAAAQKDGTPITADLTAKMQALAQQAGAAADALAKAKLASQIDFGVKTAFLTPQDLQIATQLKTIYGNDLPAALASTEYAALKAADDLKQISMLGQDVNRGFLVDFETGLRNGQTAWQSFAAAGVNALGKIADKLASMAADDLWKAAFPGGSSGLLALLGINDANPGTAANPLPGLTADDYAAKGKMFGNDNHIIPFAGGGSFTNSIVNSPTLFKFAGGTGMMGEAGPEAIMPLKRGVDGSLGVSGGGGGSVTVNVNVDNTSGSDVSVGSQKNSSGGVDLNIMVRKAVDKNIASGFHDKSMKARFGASPVRQGR